MISDKELEDIGFIEDPQEYGPYKDPGAEQQNLTVDQFEKELIKKYHFKATKDTEDLYYYDSENGIYVKGGEWLINQECFKFNPEINTNKVDQIKQHIIWGNYVDRSEFNKNIEWLACKNVMVNLLTGETKKHSPDFMALTQVPHVYPFNAVCMPSKILKFMREVMAPEDVETVLDFMAYCLWRDFPFHRWLILNGSGRNGKGVTTNIITKLLGKQNVSNEMLNMILSNNFSAANLHNKMANIDADLSSKALSDTGILKKLTGGDDIRAEFKYKPAFSFENYAKLIFAVNTIPETPDETDAFFARPLIINFPNQFIGEKANPNLINELAIESEMSALLGLLVRRVPRILKDGISYEKAHSIEQNYNKYIRSSQPIRYFAETALRKDDEVNAHIALDEMYESYCNFCDHHKLTKESDYVFSRELKKQGYDNKTVKRSGIVTRKWVHVKIIDWKNPKDDDQEMLDLD
jgi:putative DNA primase/helicase